jgi:hypothetical protein
LSRRFLLPIAFLLLLSIALMPGMAAAKSSEPSLVPTHLATDTLATVVGSSTATNPLRGHPPSQEVAFDEQIGLTFTQNFTSMEYNVTAVPQTDPTLGTGPGYLLSGLSNMGNWYQVGLSYDWSTGIGFAMNYEVFNSAGDSIFPTSGGGGIQAFSGPVNPGDNVTLNLYFNSAGQVAMIAEDMNTGASSQVEYSGAGATFFVGQPNGDANAVGFFTGLMTEWYHGTPSYSEPAKVTYSTNFSISSGWMWMDEFNANNLQLVFASNSSTVTSFASSPTHLQEFSYSGITEYSDANTFVTGSPTSNTTTTSTGSTGIVTDVITTTEPVTITSTVTTDQTLSYTTTATSTVTAPPSTTTATQILTKDVTPSTSLSLLGYGLIAVFLLIGIGAGYLVRRSGTTQRQRETAPPEGRPDTSSPAF